MQRTDAAARLLPGPGNLAVDAATLYGNEAALAPFDGLADGTAVITDALRSLQRRDRALDSRLQK